MLTWPALADYLHRHSASAGCSRKKIQKTTSGATQKQWRQRLWWGWQWWLCWEACTGRKESTVVLTYIGKEKQLLSCSIN